MVRQERRPDGSSEQDLAGDFLINFRITDSEKGLNCAKSGILGFGGKFGVVLTERLSK